MPFGSMHGTYLMQTEDGAEFSAEIPEFFLIGPRTLLKPENRSWAHPKGLRSALPHRVKPSNAPIALQKADLMPLKAVYYGF